MDEMDGDEQAVGAVDTTIGTVLNYLTHAKGGNLPREQALKLIAKYEAVVENGRAFRSFANYIGDQILRAEGLPEGTGE